jgi:hypothetical protein
MNLKLEIRNNKTGETREDVLHRVVWNQFDWEEGNHSCDCNRSILFIEALHLNGVSKPDPCGHGGYAVRCTDNDTGEVLYNEFRVQSLPKDDSPAFASREITEALDELIRKYGLMKAKACEALTEKQMAESLRQALVSGDFERLVAVDGRQCVIYLPYAEAERWKQKYYDLLTAFRLSGGEV